MSLSSVLYPPIDPVALRLGPLAIRWYGLAYLAGFLIAFLALRRMARKETLHVAADAVSELVGWIAIGVVLGGRLGWWVFYHRAAGALEPWYEPFAIWHGGMSFHGGLIGVAVALLAWSRLRHASVWNLADCLSLVTPIGLSFGRIANFINAELVGRPTAVPWGVIFPGESVARHPSQLYEAVLEGPLLLLVLWAARKRLRRSDGAVAALFLMFYGIFRFAVEFTRQPDSQLGFIAFGWLTMGQLLSIVIAGIGAILWITRGRFAASASKKTELDHSRALLPKGVHP